MDDSGPDTFEVLFFGFIGLFFLVIFIAVVVAIVRGLVGWSRNNAAPRISVPALVIAKRTNVSGGSGDSSASTSYFVTFEVQGGERLEMHLLGNQYGTLAEGDKGRLSYQGTRYKGFDRTPQD